MVDSKEAQEMLKRFEKEMDLPESARDSDDVLRKMAYWQHRKVSYKQQQILKGYCRDEGISIGKYKPIGISERKGISREELKRRYVPIRRKTKKGIRVTVQPRDSKTGRYVKK